MNDRDDSGIPCEICGSTRTLDCGPLDDGQPDADHHFECESCKCAFFLTVKPA